MIAPGVVLARIVINAANNASQLIQQLLPKHDAALRAVHSVEALQLVRAVVIVCDVVYSAQTS